MRKGIKSHSGAKKRIKKTASGKLIFKKAANNHLLTNKKQQNNKSRPYGNVASKSDAKKMKLLIPYK